MRDDVAMNESLLQHWGRVAGDLPDAAAGVRALAWQVRAADSEWVSRAWTLCQTHAALPAPAIAVDGLAGWQLWFALAQPRPVDEVQAVLRVAIRTWLRDADIDVSAADAQAWTFLAWPGPGDVSPGAEATPPVPRQVAPERWSAFVAPDLVPVFAESPWLDCTPGEEGQAALMNRWQPIPAEAWERLRQAAAPAVPQARAATAASMPPGEASAADPRAFLVSVMNDPAVDMALRIEAARALLAHG